MEDLVDGWPVWAVFAILFLGAFVRGLATHLVGRGLRTGGERSTRLARGLDRPMVHRAEEWVRTWGPPLVSLGFLTVGVQTAINAASGVLRMPMRRFLPALVVGALLWAALYATVGLAVVDAALGGLPWWAAVLAVSAIGATVLVSRVIRRRVNEGTSS